MTALIPGRWRWAHRLYASMLGYFWEPCPLCGRMFGGHEWINGDHAPGSREAICPWCTREGRGVPWTPRPAAGRIVTRRRAVLFMTGFEVLWPGAMSEHWQQQIREAANRG